MKPGCITCVPFSAGWLACVLVLISVPSALFAPGYDVTFEMRNKLKVELQYADYGQYEYPEPVIFIYGVQDYAQNYPYIVNFPERRGLFKFTRMVGASTALSAKYQFSRIRKDVDQHLAELKITRTLGPGLTGLAGGQLINDTRGFNSYQAGTGIRWDISPLTILQGDVQYYFRGSDAEPVGGKLDSWNLRFKFRQVLTLSTALFLEYQYYDAAGDRISFTSHALAVWLSQYLPTQTALHANLRVYHNSMGIQSLAPSLEIAQYIDWATVLRLKYRYYTNESENVSLGEEQVIIPDGLRTHAATVQLNRVINPDLEVYAKYRYYKSNLQIQMNTYLFGFVLSF